MLVTNRSTISLPSFIRKLTMRPHPAEYSAALALLLGAANEPPEVYSGRSACQSREGALFFLAHSYFWEWWWDTLFFPLGPGPGCYSPLLWHRPLQPVQGSSKIMTTVASERGCSGGEEREVFKTCTSSISLSTCRRTLYEEPINVTVFKEKGEKAAS